MSAELNTGEFPQSRGDRDTTDAEQAHLGFGDGGVPWLLVLLYLSFLTFFTWYALEYQLPNFLESNDVPAAQEQSAPND